MIQGEIFVLMLVSNVYIFFWLQQKSKTVAYSEDSEYIVHIRNERSIACPLSLSEKIIQTVVKKKTSFIFSNIFQNRP